MVFYLRHTTRLVRDTGPVVGRYLLENLGDCPPAEVYAEGKTVYQWTCHFCDPLQRDVAPGDDVPKADVVEVREGMENKCPRHAE
jgi:cytochrome c5